MPPRGKAKEAHASTTSGGYTKLREVGKSEGGAIWLVRHTLRGGDVFLLKEVSVLGQTPSECKATMQEIEVLSRIAHKNVIRLHDSFGCEGNSVRNSPTSPSVPRVIGMVMEYLSGGDLGTFISNRAKEKQGFTSLGLVPER